MLRGKIKDFFDIIGGNSGLTEEFIYNNQPKDKEDAVTVYSGSTVVAYTLKDISKHAKILKNNKLTNLKWFHGNGIIIARNGKAGSMFYVNKENFTMNDHAYYMKVKKKYEDKINPKYIIYATKELIKECVSSNGEGKNGTFSKTIYEQLYINIPIKNEQDRLVHEYEKYENIKKQLEDKIDKICKILSKTPHLNHGEVKSVEKVFNILSEDRSLTEEFIYKNQGQFPVYSAQKNGAFGYINKYSFDGEVLTIVQYGDSGKTFIRNDKLNIGRNICGLVQKKDFKEKINLKYMKYALEHIFIEAAKGDGLKSLSQETIKKTNIFLPDIKTQNLIADEYEKFEKIKHQLETILYKLNRVLD